MMDAYCLLCAHRIIRHDREVTMKKTLVFYDVLCYVLCYTL